MATWWGFLLGAALSLALAVSWMVWRRDQDVLVPSKGLERKVPLLFDPLLPSLKCHLPDAPTHPRLVVGVKTTRFYHSTRAKALWEAWGQQLGHALIFVTDGPMQEAADWPASVIVVEDIIDASRTEAYVPPWRVDGEDPDDVDPFRLPQLTRRVAAVLEAAQYCWGKQVRWFLLVDDDTFVRPDLLLKVLTGVDDTKPQLLGKPTSSDQFTLPAHMERFGPSVHCGGSNILLSWPLLDKVVDFAEGCLAGPGRTTLAWYWDEVELLGRCVYEQLHLNCSLPPNLPRLEGELDLGLMMSVSDVEDYNSLDAYVKTRLEGLWERLPIATLHPVEAPYMRWLGRRFPRTSTSSAHGAKQRRDASRETEREM